MTTQELHIELDVLLQKIDSNWNKNLLPQEKDLFINNEIRRFIKQRISPLSNRKGLGAFDTIKRVEDLDDLVKTEIVQIYYPNDQREALVMFPFDFLSYISSGITVCCNCKESAVMTENVHTATFSPLREYSQDLEYHITVLTATESYSILNTDTLPEYYLPQDNIPTYRTSYILTKAILSLGKEVLEDTGIQIRYNKKTKKIEVQSKEQISITILLNGRTEVITSTVTSNNIQKIPKELVAEVRVLDEEVKFKALRSHLSKSRPQSIVSYLRLNSLELIQPNGAIMGLCELIYYKKPKQIDLLLGIDSELSDDTLKEVIANTAETIKGVLADDSYQKYVQQNTLIE